MSGQDAATTLTPAQRWKIEATLQAMAEKVDRVYALLAGCKAYVKGGQEPDIVAIELLEAAEDEVGDIAHISAIRAILAGGVEAEPAEVGDQ